MKLRTFTIVLSEGATAANKFYALRRDHSVESRARVFAAEDRGRRAHREVCFRASPRAATTTFFDANGLYKLIN